MTQNKYKYRKIMKKLFKEFVLVTAILAAILIIAQSCMGGVTLAMCGHLLLCSAVTTAIVMAIWVAVGIWVCGPVTRFLNKTFELMGR
jgi:putative Mn2+ efflux pump MntP